MSLQLKKYQTRKARLEAFKVAWERGETVSLSLNNCSGKHLHIVTNSSADDAHVVGLPLYAALEQLNQQIDKLTSPYR